MAFNINVVNYNERRTIRSTKIALYDLVKEEDLEKFYAVKVNNRLRELTYEIHYDSTIEFLDLNDSDACSVFERSLRYLFCMAVYELYPELHFRLSYSVSRLLSGARKTSIFLYIRGCKSSPQQSNISLALQSALQFSGSSSA